MIATEPVGIEIEELMVVVVVVVVVLVEAEAEALAFAFAVVVGYIEVDNEVVGTPNKNIVSMVYIPPEDATTTTPKPRMAAKLCEADAEDVLDLCSRYKRAIRKREKSN